MHVTLCDALHSNSFIIFIIIIIVFKNIIIIIIITNSIISLHVGRRMVSSVRIGQFGQNGNVHVHIILYRLKCKQLHP